MYTFKIFENISQECEDILENKKNIFYSNFFQNIDYFKEIVKVKEIKLKIIVIYYKKEVIAILPLEIRKFYLLKILQWIGTEYSDYCNPILSEDIQKNFNKKNFIDVWKLILKELKNDFDIIFLNNQLSHINGLRNPFVEHFSTWKFSKIYNIDLANNFDNYKNDIKNKNKKYAYEIHRTLIKYEKLKSISKDLRIEILNSDQDNLNFKNILNEKKTQLAKKNIRNNLHIRYEKIFENLIKLKKINFYLISLKIEDEVLSRCFGIKYKGTFYYHIPTVLSNSYKKYKPGKILIIELIRWCIENNINKFDFGLGSENYKKHFSNKEISLHRYYNFNSFKGFVAYILMYVLFRIKKS